MAFNLVPWCPFRIQCFSEEIHRHCTVFQGNARNLSAVFMASGE